VTLAHICTKSFSGWGFAPDPTGELTALPQTPSWQRGGKGGEGEGRARERRGMTAKEGKGRGGREGCLLLNLSLVWLRP